MAGTAGLVVLIAAAATAVSAFVVFPLLRKGGIVDVPSHRSSHSEATVRGGGVAIGAGITVATVFAAITVFAEHGVLGLGSNLMPLAFLVLTWCYSAIGMADDLDSLQPLGRLFGQVVIAVVFSACIALFSTHGIAHVLAFAVIGVGLVNAVNFVDGLNGFLCSWTIVTGGWYAVVGLTIDDADIVVVSLALAGAALGFLPFNLGRAKAFLGDTGSYGIGGAVFVIAVWMFILGVPIVVIVAPMIFILFDVGMTLVRRLFQGENIFLPHRTHIYQRIQQAGWSHERVSLLHACLTVIACVLAVPTLVDGNSLGTYPSHVFWVVLLGFYVVLPIWLTKRNSVEVVTA
ncbi:UDP-N-acetylmuramyl pentapeptide phosphotransferase/UDP-N-acetylglucosamine-1-phosphate transferase [Brevibacterium sanguinis]|uniref:UDP-N-acetylmuramyl pentapeptide phosphotransferase/UDP-N-acetylglucosamine-1-phosphate transferase n=2 Tax=Brevibacterium TaxID=1696 RepID=A0A366IGW2_9MICO|nr:MULTISPECIES: glycosyltransferase family 4 protein [Brevibacterium]RBP62933.1 UDP-N-acetylmuramyl pentapeptide phosphotransferase/UDP-N-acetylglucosamine-1-phosphate transferase [Brevibacterium sanguinis]RBP69522.1 UDP-N-acetylmuramyl pentapeptide phosphotransferase/UDP-N-acetylglucosamine-1-phosphate transferase [Brevibacterium celere]